MFYTLKTESLPSLLDDDPFANQTVRANPSLPDLHPRSRSRSPRHTRPAPRPAPSLHALAQLDMDSVPERKVRKGTPGAQLPHEPWNMDLAWILTRHTPSSTTPGHVHPPAVQTAPPTETCFEFRESTPSLAGETLPSYALSGDDAEMDSLPSLSYSPSNPPSSALSRSSPIDSSALPKNAMGSSDPLVDDDIAEEDPLSYHSDFDYYTQSLSDLSDSEPDPDLTTGENPTHHSSPHIAITPYSSVYNPDMAVEPVSSPDIIHKTSELPHSDARVVTSSIPDAPHDGGGTGQCARQDMETAQHVGRNGDCSGSQSRGGGAGGDDNHGNKACRRNRRSSVSSTSSYTSSSDDDADGVTVYYSLDGMSNGAPSCTHSRTCSRYSKAGGGSDDDVPLAQRVPTALSAQKSIRKQLHDERWQRKLERAKSSRAAEPHPPSRPTEPVHVPAVPARFRKRSVSAAPTPAPRTVPAEAFAVEDLTRKLARLQSSRTPPFTAPLTHGGTIPTGSSARVPVHSGGLSRSSSRGRYTDYPQQKTLYVPEASSQDRPLRSMRSFHRSNGRHSEIQRQPTEQAPVPRLGRSTTTATSSRTIRAVRDNTPVGYDHVHPSRVSEDGRRPSASIPRSSTDREGDLVQRVAQRPPIPPLPVSDATPPQHVARVPVVQQRVFIGDMQRFNIVEITPGTNAGGVVDTVASQGMLDRSGSWMLFEMAQDYGMERPIREYELLADVSASWNKDKLLNAFVIKQTPLAQLLSHSALPTSSPMHRGWVEWESKRGKWSKRWMELREHGLWLSKRDTGKDEVFLCSLSNFDAYFVTRRHKSPKAFVFAVKSTDHPSLFENAADYLHVFSCNPSDGEKWMQVILVARSYVLYQERHVLFAKTAETQAKPLARSRTRKQSISSRPAQPLVNVPPPFSQSTSANVAFEPGSLLAKRKGDA